MHTHTTFSLYSALVRFRPHLCYSFQLLPTPPETLSCNGLHPSTPPYKTPQYTAYCLFHSAMSLISSSWTLYTTTFMLFVSQSWMLVITSVSFSLSLYALLFLSLLFFVTFFIIIACPIYLFNQFAVPFATPRG